MTEREKLYKEKIDKAFNENLFNLFCSQVFIQMFSKMPSPEELQKFKNIHTEQYLKKLQSKTQLRFYINGKEIKRDKKYYKGKPKWERLK